MFRALRIAVPAILIAAVPATANEFEGALRDLAEKDVRAFVQ